MSRNHLSFLVVSFMMTVACTSANCRTSADGRRAGRATSEESKEQDPMNQTSVADRVMVYKNDGSLQCDQGKPISVTEMQNELKSIKVYSAGNRNDGMMRIMQCGTPTGNCNVYEIDRANLAAALKLGFKEWVKK